MTNLLIYSLLGYYGRKCYFLKTKLYLRNDICICSWDTFVTCYQLFFFSYQLFELKLPTFSTELPTSCSVQVSTFFLSYQLIWLDYQSVACKISCNVMLQLVGNSVEKVSNWKKKVGNASNASIFAEKWYLYM